MSLNPLKYPRKLTHGALCPTLTLRAARLKCAYAALIAAVTCCSLLFAMSKPLLTPTGTSARSSAQGAEKGGTPVGEVVRDERVKSAREWLAKNTAWVTLQQKAITEIPAPSFGEKERGAFMKQSLAACGLRVKTDEIGNVIGEFPGSSSDEIVLIVAHMDTVFPAGTEVTVREDKGVLSAPGISDNGTGLATLVAIARAMNEAKVRTRRTILFAADVGEEGEGNLRGIRKLVEDYKAKLVAVIALDGASTEYVVTQALASRRVEVTITGPGGHSWTDFGAPNPIDAMARGIARFVKTDVTGTPRTTYNIGQIEGGGSVNSIPARASIKVDIRSEQEKELGRLETALRDSIRAGIQEEMGASTARGMAPAGGMGLEMQVRSLGARPGGELAANSPLLRAVLEADRVLGNQSRVERSSTDANIPLSLGIPAIGLGCGGRAGGAHTTSEWYDPAGRELGLQRVLFTVLSAAGVEK